jgi:hypothetical protein
VSTTPAKNNSPVSLTPTKHVFAGVNDTGEACHRCCWQRWRHASPVSLIPGSKDRRWHRWCTSRTIVSSPMPLKEQSLKKQAISRYYFSIASIQSSKESSDYNKIVCFAGVSDTGKAPEKSNISANIRNSKSFLGLSTGTRRSCLKKKTRGEKSGGTVPLTRGMIPTPGIRFSSTPPPPPGNPILRNGAQWGSWGLYRGNLWIFSERPLLPFKEQSVYYLRT